MPAAKSASGLYSVHPSLGMVEKWKNELPQKTGRSLDGWVAFVKKAGPATERERREWLKKEHKLGTNSAWWIAERAEDKGTEDGDPEAYLKAAEKYVEDQYAGPKAHLRPIYNRILELA